MHQQLLKELGFDGWLLYDFRGSNPLAQRILRPKGLLSRRLFYWIPASGTPVKLLHKIESHALDHLPGELRLYGSWQELKSQLSQLVHGRIAMEVSDIPYISTVDAGTADLVRSCGAEICSSGDLLQQPLTSEQEESHLRAAEAAMRTFERTWAWIGEHLQAGSPITEIDVQECILGELAAQGMVTDHRPICAVNAHSADPHHLSDDTQIQPDDWILIDFGCRTEEGIYADYTQMAGRPTAKQQEIFQIVKEARDAAIDLVKSRSVQGWEVDRVARQLIEERGFGAYFLHRTGHNIDQQMHGSGAHCDDYETHDTRKIIPGSCFSIEPGIYLPGKFGVRLEVNLLLRSNGELLVTGTLQDAPIES